MFQWMSTVPEKGYLNREHVKRGTTGETINLLCDKNRIQKLMTCVENNGNTDLTRDCETAQWPCFSQKEIEKWTLGGLHWCVSIVLIGSYRIHL